MSNYSIYASLRTDKPLKNNKYPIYLRVTIMGRETKIPTSYEIEKSLWDSRARLPKKQPLRTLIGNIASELENYFIKELALGEKISIDTVKDFRAKKRRVKPENESFYDHYINFVEGKKKEGRDADTIRIYRNTYNALKEFKPNLRVCDINLKFIEKFDEFLRDVKGNEAGGRENKHKNIRAVILYLIRHETNIKNPYPNFKIPKASIRETYLSFDELVALKDIEPQITDKGKRRMGLHMFLFACYTGFRISDIKGLCWSHIDWKKQLIKKRQQKTGENVIAVIPPWGKSLLLEYSNNMQNLNTDKPVFPNAPSGNAVNNYLKEFTQLAGITKHITCHVARHTFGTLSVLNGTDILTVSKLLGHSDLATTMVYFNDAQKLIDNHSKTKQLFSN